MFALMTAIMGEPALAELQGAPEFSTEEKAIIARNEALSKIVGSNPWAVRNLLDIIKQARQRQETSENVSGTLPQKDGLDPSDNPDIERLQRVSPEAAHDLFQLLKQAREKKPVGSKEEK